MSQKVLTIDACISTTEQRIVEAKKLISGGALTPFMSVPQRLEMLRVLRGEEAEGMVEIIMNLDFRIKLMPKSYETDGQGKSAVVYLHYFGGSSDAYITEKDVEGGVDQAFGWADCFGDGGEYGYISIREWVENNMELDLYWTPKPIGEVLKGRR